MRTIAAIQEQLPTTPDSGLSADGRAKSKQLFGANRLTPLPREPLWKKFLGKFDEPIIKILLAAALLSMIVDLLQPPVEARRALPAAVVVALTLVLAAGAYLRQRGE